MALLINRRKQKAKDLSLDVSIKNLIPLNSLGFD